MNLDDIELLTKPENYKYIDIYKNHDSKDLALKISKNSMLPARAIAEQVLCYQKAKKKLPSFIDKNLLFDRVALEQSSSEATASYKSSIISGNSIIDLTGGLGIDELFFVNAFNNITYCELNEVVYSLFKHNVSRLNISNITVNNTDSIEYLSRQENNSFDWIYIDPSRRDVNRRSVDLEYCTPNVYDNMELFFEKSENVMIKTAPAYDLTEAMRRFPNLTEIHVLSVDGECKEVLLLLKKNYLSNSGEIESFQKLNNKINPRFKSGENELIAKNSKWTSVRLESIKVISATLNSKNDKRFILTGEYSKKPTKVIAELNSYFYEPDCSIIKSNLTPLLAEKYNLAFVNKLTPYLTNTEVIEDFPGRSFKVLDSLPFNEKLMRKYLKENKIVKANVSKRDFKLSVDEIRSRFKLKDGGDKYLFFTRDFNNKSIMIVCKKII